MSLRSDPCIECGGKMVDVPDVFEESVHEAIEQSARVFHWTVPQLRAVESMAVLKRF